MLRLVSNACLKTGILALVVFQCGQAAPQSSGDQNGASEKFARILILPVVNMSEIHGQNASLRGPLSGEVFVTDEVAPKAADFMGATFRNRLMRLEQVELVEPSTAAITARVGVAPLQGPREGRIAAIQEAGRQKGADSVFCTYLYAFRKRVGTAYGVDAPAMISFESVLVSVATGRLIWQDSYSETQQTLNDNLLRIDKFMERRGRWITAEEMASQAVDKMMENFSAGLRKK